MLDSLQREADEAAKLTGKKKLDIGKHTKGQTGPVGPYEVSPELKGLLTAGEKEYQKIYLKGEAQRAAGRAAIGFGALGAMIWGGKGGAAITKAVRQAKPGTTLGKIQKMLGMKAEPAIKAAALEYLLPASIAASLGISAVRTMKDQRLRQHMMQTAAREHVLKQQMGRAATRKAVTAGALGAGGGYVVAKETSEKKALDMLRAAISKVAKKEEEKKLDPDVAVYKTYYGRWPHVRAGVEAVQGGLEGGIIGGAVGTPGGRGRAAAAGAAIGVGSGLLDAVIERMSERGRQKFLKTREGRQAMKE